MIEIKNIEYLRNKLLDYVGTAAFSGIPAAFGDILEIEKMSIFEECFFRGIKFIYRKENDSTTYIPTKEKTIAINRNNGY